MIIKFLAMFVPTLALALAGLWLALNQNGLLSLLGWVIAIPVGLVSLLEVFVLVNGLIRIGECVVGAKRLAERDAELFAQGKSFDEVMAQYKEPKE